MPIFHYKALNKEGSSYEGTMEAADRFAVYRKIRESGDSVIFATEERGRAARLFSNIGFGSKVKQHDKIIFARNLAAMIEAGLPVTRALAVMEKQAKQRALKITLKDLIDDVTKGKSLSESMKSKEETFSPLMISMVKAGEESGNLAGSLKVVALQMDKAYTLAKKVRGALMYPAVIVVIMIGIATLLLIFMVPTLTATFKGLGIELPIATRAVIAVSDFLREQWYIALAGVIGLVVSFVAFWRSRAGKRFFDSVFLRVPLIGGIVKEVNAARTTRTLSSLLSSGVDVVVALGVTADVLQNGYYKAIVSEAQQAIEKGDPMSMVFIKHERLYPIFVGEMMSVGEETGKMADMLLGVAEFYEQEVDQKTKDMSTLIEPFLMVLMGIAVGFFAISMLAPTYSLVDAI
jgi:type IV pilus assembly protein PilC